MPGVRHRDAHFGVPEEVLTDNGKQFTGRFTKPRPIEVLFERICRENGVTVRNTKPRSPTTTGKIERWHKTVREEFLSHEGFASLQAAQALLDACVADYNAVRPHQALDMATPADLSRQTNCQRSLPHFDVWSVGTHWEGSTTAAR
ncbi:hypothetical protein GCM10009525_51740 [Streptosporangium amethystogenes subsp. fukuiense]